ncbi:hypothetical protein ONZ45_g4371 [Pleurotus djamor]|nr:hypothetical protein ONZ45_g4371 [Pleurotus djamor]
MFPPVADFNLVVCGFATVAATVGYAYSRRHPVYPSPDDQMNMNSTSELTQSTSATYETKPLSEPTSEGKVKESVSVQSDHAQPESVIVHTFEPAGPSNVLSRRSSLKRKRLDDDDDHSDEGYPLNLLSIYPPAKRSKTPPTDKGDDISDTHAPEASTASAIQSAHDVVGDREPENGSRDRQLREDHQHPAVEDVPSLTASPRSIASDDASEGTLATPPDLPIALPPSPQKEQRKVASCPPAPIMPVPITKTVSPTATVPSTPTRSPPKRSNTFGSGFAAFAGKGSAFGSPSKSPSMAKSPERPAWCSPSGSSIFSAESSLALGVATDTTEKPAIAPAEVVSTPCTHMTGEEEETVELEAKSVKLYVKRGKKNFSEGMTGHIKVLASKGTDSERLLFRRDPLWKVSMNVRLNTSVRCTYDAEEHILRVVLAEPVETPDVPVEQWPREVVVYALKPSRSLPKADFKDFAEALIARSSLAES